MRWMKTLTRQYAWISGWLVILSLQDLNHLSPWWRWTLRKTLSSLPVDQVNQFIRLFRSQTQAILQFTTACSLIQQTLSKLILRMVWFRDRALVSSVLNSTQRRQEIITSKHSAFSTIETGLGVTTKICTASYKTPGADPLYHLQTTNNYHERLKTWINRDLRGVATKYLSNYLAWMRMLAWEKEGLQPREFILSAMGKQVINT